MDGYQPPTDLTPGFTMAANASSSSIAAEGRADADGGSHGWWALWILTVLLAGEACLLGWCFVGGWLRDLDGKRWAAFAAIMMLGGLQSHIRQHRDAYRAVRVSWPLVAGQIAAFAGVLAYAGWLASGGRDTPLGSAGELVTGGGLAVAWFVFSLLLVAPGAGMVRSVLTTVLGFGLFAFAAWHVGTLTMGFWQATGDTTLRLVELLLVPLAGGPVVRPQPFAIGTPEFTVLVTESCGGFHGIGLVTALLVGYLWWFRDVQRFPQSLLLVPIGMALMWLANVLRITSLVLVGIWISPDIAVEGFHSAAGWIAFLAVGLGLIWTASRMPFFSLPHAAGPAAGPVEQATLATNAPRAGHPPSAGHPPLADHAPATDQAMPTGLTAPTVVSCILPFLALMAVTILTRAFTAGFDLLYPLRVVAVAAVLWRLRGGLPWRTFRIRPAAVAIGAATFAVWMALAPAADAGTGDDPNVLGWPWSAAWLVVRVVGATVTVPIAEELFFRGFVIRRCIGPDVDAVPVGAFTWLSFLLSSVAFGVLHGDAWVAGTLAGMLFALALYTRRSLDDAVVAHATTNALLSGYVVATGSWSQWG